MMYDWLELAEQARYSYSSPEIQSFTLSVKALTSPLSGQGQTCDKIAWVALSSNMRGQLQSDGPLASIGNWLIRKPSDVVTGRRYEPWAFLGLWEETPC